MESFTKFLSWKKSFFFILTSTKSCIESLVSISLISFLLHIFQWQSDILTCCHHQLLWQSLYYRYFSIVTCSNWFNNTPDNCCLDSLYPSFLLGISSSDSKFSRQFTPAKKSIMVLYFHKFQLKSYPDTKKHSSCWKRVEDVFSITFFVFQDAFKTSSRNVFKMYSWNCCPEDVFNPASRRLGR